MPPHKNPDADSIRSMFDRLAHRYDLFNHLTSMGLATWWRKKALLPLERGMRVLDLGCGTGDLTLAAAKKIAGSGEVVGLDFSENMLAHARRRYAKLGLNGSGNARFVRKKAEELPLEGDRPYDLIVSGFVLRNLYENIDPILEGVYRSLKSGGRIRFLDITEPSNPVKRFFWKTYMATFAVLYGKILFGKDYPAFYLTESAKRFVKPAEFIAKLERCGFKKVSVERMMLGSVALYSAEKALA